MRFPLGSTSSSSPHLPRRTLRLDAELRADGFDVVDLEVHERVRPRVPCVLREEEPSFAAANGDEER